MIDIAGLTKKFGDLTAVDNLTLHVDDGEVFGFLGPNDAGKTTKVRMLCYRSLLSDYSWTEKKLKKPETALPERKVSKLNSFLIHTIGTGQRTK